MRSMCQAKKSVLEGVIFVVSIGVFRQSLDGIIFSITCPCVEWRAEILN